MVTKKNSILGFVKATSQNVLDALNGLGGNFGYNFQTKRFFMTLDDGQAPKDVASTEDIANAISSLSVSNASETVKGIVEMATTAQFQAGTDVDPTGTGAPLTVKPSDVKNALDTKATVAGDLNGTAAVPHVQSSTTTSGLFKIQNIGGTIAAAWKAVTGGALQARLADDSGLADVTMRNAIVQDLTVSGNVYLNGPATQVNSTNTTVKDNIVVYNDGEPGAGVTAVESGFEVDRGSLARFRAVWNETIKKFTIGEAGNEKIVSRGAVLTIVAGTNPAATSHDLVHNLKSTNILAVCWDGNFSEECVFEIVDANTIKAHFVVPTTDRKFVITSL